MKLNFNNPFSRRIKRTKAVQELPEIPAAKPKKARKPIKKKLSQPELPANEATEVNNNESSNTETEQ